ncbi:hypothetical protein NUW58_g8138 [Xylaria curta]|uniref:Uncharacterized protein n=1 Tax=Xylaria curta TaxID=42375 RepID=A0ACC1NBI1_9PEZI|nr:hypothetical protein NUW58_g8138 [Xylaria curta]
MSMPGPRRVSGGAASLTPRATLDDETMEEYADIFAHMRATDEARARAGDLQNLWHLYYVASKHCSEDAVAPVVLQLLETSQRGLLARNQIGSSGAVEAEHAPVVVRVGSHIIQQYIWQDLPFLVPDMTSYWIQDCAQMSCSQRVRTSSFWASLGAAHNGGAGLL